MTTAASPTPAHKKWIPIIQFRDGCGPGQCTVTGDAVYTPICHNTLDRATRSIQVIGFVAPLNFVIEISTPVAAFRRMPGKIGNYTLAGILAIVI